MCIIVGSLYHIWVRTTYTVVSLVSHILVSHILVCCSLYWLCCFSCAAPCIVMCVVLCGA